MENQHSHFVLRYRQMKPEIAIKALWATHGGLSLELCTLIENVDAMVTYRLVCLVRLLTRLICRCHRISSRTKNTSILWTFVYLPTIGGGRGRWHLGFTTSKSVVAFCAIYAEFKQAALAMNPSYRVKGIDRPNQVWSTNLTYIRLEKGFVYLIAIIDWFSRYVLSWELSNSQDVFFCLAAVEMR